MEESPTRGEKVRAVTMTFRGLLPKGLARNSPMVTAGVTLLLLYLFGALRHTGFATAGSAANLLSDYAPVGIAAVGATLVIISGGIDLSVGSAVVFSSVLCSHLVAREEWHPLCAMAAGVTCGGVMGATMGLLIAGLELPAFMVTLAGMFAIRAAAFLVEDESLAAGHAFATWVHREWKAPIWGGAALEARAALMLLVFASGWTIAVRTRLGRRIHAVGGQEGAAMMMGVPVKRTKILTYTIAGMCAGLAGWVMYLYQGAGDPTAGLGLELTVIAAVVLGGTPLSGGQGTVAGTFIGVMILGVIRMIINYEGNLNAAWTSVATGALLLAFVCLQRLILQGGKADR